MKRTKSPIKNLTKVSGQEIKTKVHVQVIEGKQYLIIPLENIPRLEQLSLITELTNAGTTPAPAPDKKVMNKKNKTWLPFAKKLFKALVEKNKVRVREGQAKKLQMIYHWAGCFRLLHEQDGVSIEVINEVLDWYIPRIASDPYIPQAFSGPSFRKKFNNIEAAKERSKWEKKQEQERAKKLKRKYKEWDGIRYYYNPDDGHYYNKAGVKWTD